MNTVFDSEQQIIGSILLRPQYVYAISSRVSPQDFADPQHRAAYGALLEIERAGDPIGPVPLKNALLDLNVFRGVDVVAYLVQIGNATPTAEHWQYHATRIIEARIRRNIATALEETEAQLNLRKPLSEIAADWHTNLSRIQNAINELDPGRSDAVQHSHTIINEMLEELERGQGVPISTGIEELDFALGGGLCYGEMTIVGGRPSMGKTMVALQMLDHFSSSGRACLFISEEMSRGQIAKRLLKRLSTIGEDMWLARTRELAQQAAEWNVGRADWMFSKPCGTIDRAIALIERMAHSGMRIVAVDYAQLLHGSGEGLYEQASHVSMRLREVTSEYELMMICLCQLSRKAEEHEGMPRMSDLKQTGQFEQDADVVMFVDWPRARGDQRTLGDDYCIHIRKNRNRETLCQDVQLKFDRRRQNVYSP